MNESRGGAIARLLRLALAVGLILLFPTTSRAISYTFTRIADTSGPFGSFDFVPAINKSGTAAFVAQLDDGRIGIFTGNGGPPTTIVTSGGMFGFVDLLNFSGFVSINDAGTVAFRAGLGPGANGIFVGTGGSVTPIATSSGPLAGFSPPSINALGAVAFKVGLDAGGTAIFLSDGTKLTALATTPSPFRFLRDFVSVNDEGKVVFVGQPDAGREGVFIADGTGVSVIATDSGPFSDFDTPAINDTGAVALQAGFDAGGSGIVIADRGGLRTIVTREGPFSGFGPPSINNLGQIAFLAGLDVGGQVILTGSDAVADKVTTTGDILFGSMVVNLSVFHGLNDAGQVAFRAVLADGTQGIYRADPVSASVPEPGTLALLSSGIAGLGGLAWRRCRRVAKTHGLLG